MYFSGALLLFGHFEQGHDVDVQHSNRGAGCASLGGSGAGGNRASICARNVCAQVGVQTTVCMATHAMWEVCAGVGRIGDSCLDMGISGMGSLGRNECNNSSMGGKRSDEGGIGGSGSDLDMGGMARATRSGTSATVRAWATQAARAP